MRAFVLFVAAGLALAGAVAARSDDTDPEPQPADKGALVGEWELVTIKQKGIEMPLPANVLQLSIKFAKDGSVTMNVLGMTQKGKWKIDASKKPRHIDITTDNKMSSPGIYKLEKGELTVASDEPGKPRPKDFESATATMVLKKKKP